MDLNSNFKLAVASLNRRETENNTNNIKANLEPHLSGLSRNIESKQELLNLLRTCFDLIDKDIEEQRINLDLFMKSLS